jgi:signal transduction histidine kinase/ActR/RegA family two-component response regulator
MRISVTLKIIIVVFLVIFGFSLFLGTYFVRQERITLQKELYERIKALGNNLAVNSEFCIIKKNKAEAQKLTDGVIKQEDIVNAFIYDEQWNLLAASKNEEAGESTIKNMTYPVISKRGIYTPEEEKILGDDAKIKDKNIGRVIIGFSLKSFESKISGIKNTILIIVLFSLFIPAIIIILAMNRWIIRPIQHLVLATEKIAQGNLDIEVPIKANDEIGDLGKAFNKMTGDLSDYRTQIEGNRKLLEDTLKERTRELQKTYDQLLQSSKMAAIGTLAAGISHDFNNILFAIIGNLELLKLDLKDNQELYHLAETIEKSAQRAAGLTKELLNFSKSAKNVSASINLNDTVNEVFGLLKRTVEKMIDIKTNLASDLWMIDGDPAQIYQIILNICINAKEAIIEQGTGELQIETVNKEFSDKDIAFYPQSRPGKYIMVSIADTGTGMDNSVMQRIFDPFFTTKPVGKGIGLGLSVTFGIVKSHGGFINVYSEKGKGSIFKIYLPVSKKQSINSNMEIKTDELLSKGVGTILIVDDEDTIRIMLKTILEKFGYTVFDAADGKKAAELYQQRKDEIDMVILDLVMPGWSGVDTLKVLKQHNPKVKVVISSGYSNDIAKEEVYGLGIYGFIQKPYVIKELLNEIKDILNRKD